MEASIAVEQLTDGCCRAQSAFDGLCQGDYTVHVIEILPIPRQGWEDVGGMDEVCSALQESLELPTRYARLVAKAPLRLRTGIDRIVFAHLASVALHLEALWKP